MKLRPLITGIATLVPGVKRIRPNGGGATASARYCYSVWLRHLVMAHKNALNTFPRTVAELGPGDSLGIGLSALASGAERYYALDVVPYSSPERNLSIFDEIIALFRQRTDIPGREELPAVKPYLDDYSFPSDILTAARLEEALDDVRLERIRHSIKTPNRQESLIDYIVPWFDDGRIRHKSVDMLYSQTVLQHVDELAHTYQTMYDWLRDDGYISHQIDLTCRDTSEHWNGHWTLSDFQWKLIRGKRPYLINRVPHSQHLELLRESGFRVVCDKTVLEESKIGRQHLAKRFSQISDEDLTTRGAFIQAVKQ